MHALRFVVRCSGNTWNIIDTAHEDKLVALFFKPVKPGGDQKMAEVCAEALNAYAAKPRGGENAEK